MKHFVKLYCLESDFVDRVAGTITFDGNSLSGDTRLAKHILAGPVWLPDGREVFAKDDPQIWFENLYQHFKSYALRATEPLQTA
jgi:hypothetical protein